MESLPLCFRILDETVTVETPRLPSEARLDDLLPALRALDDAAVDIAARRHGRPVTCAKGCSACCRIQLVPVTPAEAYALLRMIESLPEPRRTQIRSRFSERVAKLEAAELADFFRETDAVSKAERMRENMPRYLELGLACPFLEADACSIYQERPYACREYLVSSPKELCARPLTEPVQVVPTILPMARATMDAAAVLSGRPQRMVPLTLALEFAELHRAELERRYPAGQVLAESLARVFSAAYRQGSMIPESS
jgi:Fe-S-cluster containining protein